VHLRGLSRGAPPAPLNQNSGLQGCSSASRGTLAGNDLGIDRGWKQSRPSQTPLRSDETRSRNASVDLTRSSRHTTPPLFFPAVLRRGPPAAQGPRTVCQGKHACTYHSQSLGGPATHAHKEGDRKDGGQAGSRANGLSHFASLQTPFPTRGWRRGQLSNAEGWREGRRPKPKCRYAPTLALPTQPYLLFFPFDLARRVKKGAAPRTPQPGHRQAGRQTGRAKCLCGPAAFAAQQSFCAFPGSLRVTQRHFGLGRIWEGGVAAGRQATASLSVLSRWALRAERAAPGVPHNGVARASGVKRTRTMRAGSHCFLVNLPGWCWAEIQQFALVGSSSSLHSEACNALGASDGVIHSRISQEAICFRAIANKCLCQCCGANVVFVRLQLATEQHNALAHGKSAGIHEVVAGQTIDCWGRNPAKIERFTLMCPFHGNL
jgi:hypothetical protein